MTSYIPLLLKGKLYPAKVGGYTGKDEPRVKLTKEQDREIERAIAIDDQETIDKNEKLIMETAVEDIKNAYQVWIKKEYSRLIPLGTKELQFVIGGKVVTVPVRSLQRYGKPPEKPSKAASAKAAWFGTDGVFMPFKRYSNKTLFATFKQGVKLLEGVVLSEKERKKIPVKKVTTMPGDAGQPNPAS